MKQERLKKLAELASSITEELKNLEAEIKQQKEWKPEEDEKYWYIDIDTMTVRTTNWYDDENDNIRLNHKVAFKTEEEAEEYLQYLTTKEKAINKFTKKEWENDVIYKYYIKYNHIRKGLEIDVNWVCQPLQQPYFYTEEDAEAFIEKYEKCIKRDMGICEN